jgi:hypothetical protein
LIQASWTTAGSDFPIQSYGVTTLDLPAIADEVIE